MPAEITYERPVRATLHVHLDNGEIFPATTEELKKFRYIHQDETFSNGYQRLITLFKEAQLFDDSYRDVSDLEINPLFSFFTYVIQHPNLLDHWENEQMFVSMVNMERCLRGLEPLPVPSYEELSAKNVKGD